MLYYNAHVYTAILLSCSFKVYLASTIPVPFHCSCRKVNICVDVAELGYWPLTADPSAVSMLNLCSVLELGPMTITTAASAATSTITATNLGQVSATAIPSGPCSSPDCVRGVHVCQAAS